MTPFAKKLLNEYIADLKMTFKNRLIVEGRSDKNIFSQFFDEFSSGQYNLLIDVVDDIDFIGQGIPQDNRTRIEEVFKRISLKDSKKLVGFVDREFDEFQCAHVLEDKIKGHKVNTKVVFSRGHSIENYFFDIEIMREAFREFTNTNINDTLNLFRKLFESAMYLACAVSLAAKDIGNQRQIPGVFDRVASSLSENEFNLINNSFIEINKQEWQSKLVQRLGQFEAQELINFFDQRLMMVQKADYSDVRWMCHGHIGLKVMVSMYQLCANNSNSDFLTQRENQKLLHNKLGACWGRKSRQKNCDFPQELIELLGITHLPE
jgi:hypothetical protein